MTTPRQRLVLCLDGTWNNKNDSTNVLHQSLLAFEGVVSAPDMHQRVYYDEGVGNGLLDGVTGGGFGIGLEENVREAYNWLVEHFNDTPPAKAGYVADEIYIFGFSRGAYTARSLVGFISRCGLLRRGAPLTVNQLWDAYCLIGRDHEQRRSRWNAIAGKAEPAFRQITALVTDPWHGCEPRKLAPPQTEPTPTERLLMQWSRRVRITYLGLYDTVGAMGIDALAIPGIRSQIALHHNMRPTTLIQKCRHALALDENRASFAPTPFVAYFGHTPTAGREDKTWPDVAETWRRSIEQSWFVGAHSNVGGGYADNTLAQHPFHWVLAGAMNCGLVSKTSLHNPLPPPPSDLPSPNDSFADFAAPFGTHLLRLKRHYRVIAPPPEIRAALPRSVASGSPCDPDETSGSFHLVSLNESIHPSVLAYYRATGGASGPRTLPPHLLRHALAQDPASDWGKLARAPQAARSHAWPQGSEYAPPITALWGMAAGLGLETAIRFFTDGPQAHAVGSVAALAAMFFICVDALESLLNHRLAAAPLTRASRPRDQALHDALYWVRALGVVLAVAGLLAGAFLTVHLAWRAPSFALALEYAAQALLNHTGLLAAGAVGVLLAAGIAGCARRRSLGAVPAPAVAFLLVLLLTMATRVAHHVVGAPSAELVPTASHARSYTPLAGQLLLLQIGLLYLVRTLEWTGKPLSAANLPSIVKLQFRATPASVVAFFKNWRDRLHCTWKDEDKDARHGPAAVRLRTVLAESLWRDTFGLIPIYTLVLGYGLYLFQDWFGGDARLGPAPVWLALILGAALLDCLENRLHFGYLKHQAAGTRPGMAHTLAAVTASTLKTLALLGAGLASLAVLISGTWALTRVPRLDLRGSLALLPALGIALLLGYVAFIWLRKKSRCA